MRVRGEGAKQVGEIICRACGEEAGDIVQIRVPYVFCYLVAELAALNIRVQLDVDNIVR